MSLTRPSTQGLPLFDRPEPTEAEKGREIVDGMAEEQLRASYLAQIRKRMRVVYRHRVALRGVERASVSPDDARRFFENEAYPPPPPPEEFSRSFLAAVFRTAEWVEVGRTRPDTPGSHGNEIRMYALKAWRDQLD